MISLPMKNCLDEELHAEWKVWAQWLEARGFVVLNSWFGNIEWHDTINAPLACLSKSLEVMAQCDVVLFAPGWENARG